MVCPRIVDGVRGFTNAESHVGQCRMSGCTRTPHPLHTDILVRREGGGLERKCGRCETEGGSDGEGGGEKVEEGRMEFNMLPSVTSEGGRVCLRGKLGRLAPQ